MNKNIKLLIISGLSLSVLGILPFVNHSFNVKAEETSTYHVDFCYVADHIGVDDEEVLRWERGQSKPDEHALHHFSEMFAIPMKTLLESLQEQ